MLKKFIIHHKNYKGSTMNEPLLMHKLLIHCATIIFFGHAYLCCMLIKFNATKNLVVSCFEIILYGIKS